MGDHKSAARPVAAALANLAETQQTADGTRSAQPDEFDAVLFIFPKDLLHVDRNGFVCSSRRSGFY